MHSPNPSPEPDDLWRFQRRVATYLVVGALLLTLLGVLASVFLTAWWGAALEPTLDGERVLELQRAGSDAGAD